MRTSFRRGFSGIGILMLLVVVGIILVLMFGGVGSGGKSYTQTVVESKQKGEDLSMSVTAQQLALAISAYRMEHDGKNPESYADMQMDSSSFRDQWGRGLRFKFEAKDAREVMVISDGKDEKPDTEDDIVIRAPVQN